MPSNLPPIANFDETTTPFETPVLITALDNDSDPDGNIIAVFVNTNPANGQVTYNDITKTFTYTPNSDFVGVDYFIYSVCDDGVPQLCDTAYVKITVESDSTAQLIDAEPDIEFTKQNTPVTFNILANDKGEEIQISAFPDGPDNGTITGFDPVTGEITYEPNLDFVGVDYFTYVICDKFGFCDTTLVSITVQPEDTPNQAPTANNDVATTPLDTPVTIAVLDNDSDPDNDPIT
ncbi:MAG: Ig-like domain-containing protein, partial [Bacteroidetes bacterium]|nr:Ig-like domain-containing protein [Bacteroidota bacterium]